MWWRPWGGAAACSMQIDRLLLEGFRNYDSQQLTFDGSCNVIYGENAQGKTNLLEAIVYLSCGRSPRTHADRELIGFNRDRARLVGHIQAREREFETEILLNRGRRRRMTVNGVAARKGGGPAPGGGPASTVPRTISCADCARRRPKPARSLSSTRYSRATDARDTSSPTRQPASAPI